LSMIEMSMIFAKREIDGSKFCVLRKIALVLVPEGFGNPFRLA